MNNTNTVHITIGHCKLLGVNSINTSTTTNPYCYTQRKNPLKICSKCYAKRFEALRSVLLGAFERNSFLYKKPIAIKELPVINAKCFRFHSYGELHNTLHLENYAAIARFNPETTFALWTKRPSLATRAFAPGKPPKPSNLILIYGSPYLDKIEDLPNQYFDKVFTVFTKEGAQEFEDAFNIGMNCHGSCVSCLKCYQHNDQTFIRELVK